jgi:exosortase A
MPRSWFLRIALLLSVLFWALAWYWDTAASMAAIWWRSDTFAHGLVVYPISLWLIWRKRLELAHLTCTPSLAGLAAVGLAASIWLLGELGGVQAARHLGFVAMVASTVWAVLGTSLARAIAFPLAFTLLAVPVGEFMLPMLIEHTADFTVGALRLSGIPVYREGANFVVPTGSWSVVEACSGLRYLIASVTLGLLYAYLSYRRPWRRIAFVAASVLVPIVANWVRAYMIVMIGHLSGMKYAVGVDHLLYGWVFFGIVMLMLFWIGSLWREEEPVNESGRGSTRLGAARLPASLVTGALLASALIMAAPLFAQFRQADAPRTVLPIVLANVTNGWQPVADVAPAFRPHYLGWRSMFEQTFEKNGQSVGLFIGYYSHERQDSELVSRLNAAVSPRDYSWKRVSEGRVASADVALQPVQLRLHSSKIDLALWQWYWVDGRWVVRPELLKAYQAYGKLLGDGDDAAVVVVYTSANSERQGAEPALRQFYEDMQAPLAAALEQAKQVNRTAKAPARTPADR